MDSNGDAENETTAEQPEDSAGVAVAFQDALLEAESIEESLHEQIASLLEELHEVQEEKDMVEGELEDVREHLGELQTENDRLRCLVLESEEASGSQDTLVEQLLLERELMGYS